MRDAQVVIVGGGVMGVSLLYHLSKAGWQDVVLVEKNDLTHGSTWHAAGLCTHFAHNATIQELRATSVRLYRDILPEETGLSCGFHASGAMRITCNPDRMDEFAHVAGLAQFTGYPLEVLTLDRIAELYPLAQLDGLLGGIYEPDDGHVEPTLATNAMAQVAIGYGNEVIRYSPVVSMTREQENWIVETTKETIRARHLVNAAGTWGWEVGKMMGLNIPSVPVLHQYLVTETIPEIAARIEQGQKELPIIRDPEDSWYVRQERDGLILGPYETDAKTWSVEGVPPEFGAELLPPDLDQVEHIIEAALARLPALAEAGIKSVINGPITFTPDANPLIGPVHGLDNAWLLTGSSMGVMEGGGAGWFLSHWMTHGAPPMDALAVDSRRFGHWADREYHVIKAVECFGLQFGVHYPFEERPAGRNKRLSPLHDTLLDKCAVMGAVNGWERPNWFSSHPGDVATPSFRRTHWFDAIASEVNTVTTRAGIADMSVLSKFDVKGPGTRDFIESLGTCGTPDRGKIGLSYALSPAGGVISEFSVAMLDDNHAYLTSASAAEQNDGDLLRQRSKGFDIELINQTEHIATIAVMGPRAADILSPLTDAAITSEFPWLTVQKMNLAGHPVRALCVSYIGESGWEIHVANEHALPVFEKIYSEGGKLDACLYGAYAANSMRLEKGYRAWGSDFTTERTPLESGMKYLVHSDGRNFVGRKEMLDRDQNPWHMVLLEIDGAEVDPFYSHPVLLIDKTTLKEQTVGIVTSGSYGHRVKKSLALAYIRPAVDLGDSQMFCVSVLGQKRKAEILKQAPFDPSNTRPRRCDS